MMNRDMPHLYQSFGKVILVLTCLTLGLPVNAQIEEVVVTAQKREESLTDVPVAVTALSGDDIASSYSSTLEGLQARVPSLNFKKGNTTRNQSLFLRGLGTISFSIAAEPSVSTVVDGVVMSRSGQAFVDLYDLERIEVLRGPQGTLFGKNASAGAVNIVTKGATEEVEMDAEFSYFEDEEFRGRATVSGMLTENLGGRLTGVWGKMDGYITNAANGEDVNGYNRKGGRGILEWTPREDLYFRFTADYAKADDDCCAPLPGLAPTDPTVLALLGPAAPGNDIAEGRVVNHNLVTRTEDESWGLSMQAEWDVAEHTLTSITAYREWRNREIREGDFIADAGNTFGVFELHDDGPQQFTQFSQEFRLASPTGEKLEYMIGGFIWRVDSNRSFTRNDITCIDPSPPAVSGDPCLTNAFPSATANFGTQFRNNAVFGNVTYSITDRLRLLGGVRWTDDEVDYVHVRANTSGSGGPGVRTTPNSGANETDNTDVSFKAGVQYDLYDDIMTYFTYSQGYKGPAFNVFFNMDVNIHDTPISEETGDSFEVGIKSVWFDNRLILNLAGFYAEYDGFQANNPVLIGGVVTTTLTNAGTVETSGFEIDFLANPIDNLNLSGGLAYSKAEVKNFNANPNTGIPGQPSGTALPFAPELKLGIAADYVWPLADMPYDIYFHTQYSWTDEQFTTFGEPANRFIDDHTMWDANIGIADKDDKYRLTFIIRNILDDSYVTLIDGAQGGGSRVQIPRDADRFVGVSFRASYN